MPKGVPIRLVITLLTGLICASSLLVFWLACFLTASRLTREQAAEYRRLQLSAVSDSVLQYFAAAPAAATELVRRIDRRVEHITYSNIESVAWQALMLIATTGLQGSGLAILRTNRANNSQIPGDCDHDVALVTLDPYLALLFQNSSAPTLHILPLADTVGPPGTATADVIDMHGCTITSWSVLQRRFAIAGEETLDALKGVFKWGNRWISSVGSPMLSFAVGFTNNAGTQAGILWIDVGMRPSRVAPILQKLHSGSELIFIVGHDCTLLAASSGTVFKNNSHVEWRAATDPDTHPWISAVANSLQHIASGPSCLAPTIPQELELRVGHLVANTLRVEDAHGLSLLVVSVAEERFLMSKLSAARDTTLAIGGVVLFVALVVIYVASCLMTRTLRRVCGALSSLVDLQLDAVDIAQIESHASRLKEITLLQSALLTAVRRLREYRTYLPVALYAEHAAPVEYSPVHEEAILGYEGSSANVVDPPGHTASQIEEGSNLQPSLRSPVAALRPRLSFVPLPGAPVGNGPGQLSSVPSPALCNLGLGLTLRTSSTVMIADMNQFHSLVTRCGPAELVEVHGKYVTTVLNVVRQHSGTADGFSGDHILASWNTHQPSRAHRQGACQCLIELRADLTQFAVANNLNIRIAVATGQAGFGNIGSSERRAYSVVGPVVALAHDAAKRLKSWPAEPIVAAVASTTATDEMRLIFGFQPFDAFCRKSDTEPGLETRVLHAVTSIRRSSTIGSTEWMYELRKTEDTTEHELWELVRLVETDTTEATRHLSALTLAPGHAHFEHRARSLLQHLTSFPFGSVHSLDPRLGHLPPPLPTHPPFLPPEHATGGDCVPLVHNTFIPTTSGTDPEGIHTLSSLFPEALMPELLS
eukprot:TRINITY_DN13068_c0_g1_i1.p1 TRINITY_DN13068_c0_g1~~TRINITY_DN13068_c0_g1_i1.p1  ORF type:complete len:876 (+),score=102.14 TRINITY_DN13068_c0_g1_i1:31-2658(+)